jgi:hypothetical protein
MANLRQTQSILRPNDFARFGAAFSAINHRQRARDFCGCPGVMIRQQFPEARAALVGWLQQGFLILNGIATCER